MFPNSEQSFTVLYASTEGFQPFLPIRRERRAQKQSHHRGTVLLWCTPLCKLQRLQEQQSGVYPVLLCRVVA